ncbi:MAG TPA: hypothetical protein VKI65_08495, partial [Gemmataceae bacterium]|nr:hypothetical protein [Gemmataceae bacterium]
MAEQSPSRGWRKDLPATAGRPSGAQRAWQKEAAVPGQARKGWSKKTKIALGLVGSLLVVGAFVAVILLLRPAKPVYVLAITAGYETNLAVPANVSARRTANDLKEWAGANFDEHPLFSDNADSSDWLEQKVSKADPKKVILFVAAHGAADAEGPYLIPNDVSVENRKVIRVSALLDQLKRLDKKMPKVLILGVTQLPADWSLGILHNDFASGLKKLEPVINQIDNLVVICASDADQRSWESEDGATIFGHFVVEGLKGAADKDTNGRVMAGELYSYVQEQVTQWSHSNRDALQKPILLGGTNLAAQMELSGPVPNDYQPAKVNNEAAKLPDELRTAWTKCDDLRKSALLPAAYAPHLYRQYLETLLRYEQLLRAGLGAGDGAAKQMKDEAEALHKKIVEAAQLHLDSGAKPESLQVTLTMPAALGFVPDAKEIATLRQHFDKTWNDKEPQPDAFRNLIEVKSDALKTQLRRVQLGSLLLDEVLKDPVQNLAKASNAILSIQDPPAESHFLVMLNRDLYRVDDKATGKVTAPADLIVQALSVRRLAEEAAVGLGSRGDTEPLPAYTEQVHPWIQKKVTDADHERRLGEDLLFASDDKESWSAAKKHLDAAQNLYADAQKDAQDVRQALKARDQILAELPYYSQWLARQRLREESQRRLADDRVKQVEALWKDVHQLVQLLQPQNPDRIRKDAPAGEAGPTNLIQQTTVVNKGFRNVVAVFDSHCKELSPAALQQSWHDIEAAL